MSDAEGTTGNVTDETRPISVAELLARNGKEVGATAGGRRRRGVQGGISVAELTGDIPIIRDDPPTGSIPRTHAVPEPEPEPAKAESVKAEPVKAEPVKVEPAKVSSLRLDDGAIGAFGRPSSLRLDDLAPKVREPELPAPPRAEPVDRPSDRNAMAWSSDEREPQLLSGSTVAGDLMRGSRHERDSRDDEQATDPVNNFPPVGVETGEQEEHDDLEQSHGPSIRRQWLVLLGQAVVAVVAGALLFKGFERLWDMMQWVAFALSILVILGLVAMVRILRKTDDILSIVIAIVVGVFVTMGPLVFLLSKS